MVRVLLFAVFCAVLSACATGPKKPREPNWSHAVPINHTVPPEVHKGVAN